MNKFRVIICRSNEDGPMWFASGEWLTDDWKDAKLFTLGKKVPAGRRVILRGRKLKQLDVVRFANRSRRQKLRRWRLVMKDYAKFEGGDE